MRGPSATFLAFVLLLAIILTSYWVGTASDTLALGKSLQQGFFALSGRKADGTPSGYPQGSPNSVFSPTF